MRTHRLARPLALLLGALLALPPLTPAVPPTARAAAPDLTLAWSSLESQFTKSVAWGDIDGDGDLDLAVGNYEQPSQVYRNDGGALTLIWQTQPENSNGSFAPTYDRTYAVAWADYDGDGDLDLTLGNGSSITAGGAGQSSRIYRNDGGALSRTSVWQSMIDATSSIAWGDYDGDGDLDLFLANGGVYQQNDNQPFLPVVARSRLYRNDGVAASGLPLFASVWQPDRNMMSSSAAWADYDGDGDLDLALGNVGVRGAPGEPNPLDFRSLIYRNDGLTSDGAPRFVVAWQAPSAEVTTSVAWGDVDGDGRPDLAVGNAVVGLPQDAATQSRVYRNASDGFSPIDWTPVANTTQSVAWGDYDHDGDQDLAVGNGSQPGGSLVGGSVQIFENRGGVLPRDPEWVSAERDGTFSVAWGDYDSDGDLDLATGNAGPLLTSDIPGEPNRVYRNELGVMSGAASWSTPVADTPLLGAAYGLAWGDYDGDGDPDLALALDSQPSRLLVNAGGTLTADPANVLDSAPSRAAAWGDVDGDGDLDLAVANYGATPSRLYVNNGGRLTRSDAWSPDIGGINSLSWGDVDGDADLDLAVGNWAQIDRLYVNDGGRLTQDLRWTPEKGHTAGLAWGDVDADGDLDLVTADERVASRLYRNDGGLLTLDIEWVPPASRTRAVDWGDVDGDGDLDLAMGNYGKPNWVFTNVRGALQSLPSWSSVEADLTNSVSFADIDADGDLDLLVGNGGFVNSGVPAGTPNRIYHNAGGSFPPTATWSSAEADMTSALTAGDVDGDGDLDLIAANQSQGLRLYHNVRELRGAAAEPPAIALGMPAASPPLRQAAGYARPQILDGPRVTLPFTLTGAATLPAARVVGQFSLDGGGSWQPATAAPGSQVTGLASAPAGRGYSFVWDVYADRVMGRVDQAVVRLIAIPDLRPRPGGTPRFLYGSSSAQSLPLRVRGSQVRVLLGGRPVAGAIVYRLPNGAASGARPYADLARTPFRTDAQGYLAGRGPIAVGDRLVAALPISQTETASMFFTGAAPVVAAGVQTLAVTRDNPLLLLSLDVSLEWDARRDEAFLAQLRFDLRRAAALLYDWSDGQVTLGQVTIFHDRERWDDAHIRVYATNRLRPNANQGGIVSAPLTDPVSLRATQPVSPALVYEPGQVRMGTVWSRYGEPGVNLGEDWPRALAHELGHFALFLDDDYLGFDQSGRLRTLPLAEGGPNCRSAMSDPYRDDYSEFHPTVGWMISCEATLANRSTGRSDWATIKAFYDRPALGFALVEPAAFNANPGPAVLPLDLPTLTVVAPLSPTAVLAAPALSIEEGGARVQPGPGARAVLLSADGLRLTDLGQPTLDQVYARGGREGDRVCVYEIGQALSRVGCETLTPLSARVSLSTLPDFAPAVVVTPVTSSTLVLSVTGALGVPAGSAAVRARVYPSSGAPSDAVTLTWDGGGFTGPVTLAAPTVEASVRVWVEGADPVRETVTDYSLGGSPGLKRSRQSPGLKRSRQAPAVSSDGQVIVFAEAAQFGPDDLFTIQSATSIPPPLPGRRAVGSGYWVRTNSSRVSFAGASINIAYLGRDIPAEDEGGVAVYRWDGIMWKELDTASDSVVNEASALMDGPGLYVLMTRQPIQLGLGWNLLAYTSRERGALPEALASIAGLYTVIFGYDPSDAANPWRGYMPEPSPGWVNNLDALEPGRGYWIHMREASIFYPLARAKQGAPPLPPSRLYGWSPDASPGDPVVARINGVVCGESRARLAGGTVVFVVDVATGGACGSRGAVVDIFVGSVRYTAAWDSTRFQEADPAGPVAVRYQTHLPMTTR